MRFNTRTSIPLAAAFMLAFAPLAEAKTMKFWGKLGAEGSSRFKRHRAGFRNLQHQDRQGDVPRSPILA